MNSPPILIAQDHSVAEFSLTGFFFGVIWLTMLLIAAYTDCRSRIIPNYVSLALIILYPIACLAGALSTVWYLSIGAAAISFITLFIAWQFGVLGGGDVKLLTATVLWAGTEHFLIFLFAVASAGGLVALILLVAESVKSGRFRKGFDAVLLQIMMVPGLARPVQSFIGCTRRSGTRLDQPSAPSNTVTENKAAPSNVDTRSDSLPEHNRPDVGHDPQSFGKLPYAVAIVLGGIWVWPRIFLL